MIKHTCKVTNDSVNGFLKTGVEFVTWDDYATIAIREENLLSCLNKVNTAEALRGANWEVVSSSELDENGEILEESVYHYCIKATGNLIEAMRDGFISFNNNELTVDNYDFIKKKITEKEEHKISMTARNELNLHNVTILSLTKIK